MKSATTVSLWVLASVARAAISIQDFAPETNDRFANDPAFVGAAHDWSGVGRSGDGKWAVMISSTVFLSANHFHPAIGASLSFFAGNNPAATPVSGTIAGGERIGGTDLWIGHLDAALPGGISSYSYLTVPLSDATFDLSGFAGAFSFMSGISPTTGTYGASPLTNQAVGTNRLDGFTDGLEVSGSTGDALILIQNLAGDAGFPVTSFEADLNSGDSGSPLMVVSEGQLVLAGIAWASGTADVETGDGAAERQASVYTYTGNYAAQIQSYTGSHPVPEPATALYLLAAAALVSRRTRSRPRAAPGCRRK